MKPGQVTVTYRRVKRDDGSYEYKADFAYNLSDEEREVLESLTDEQKQAVIDEINAKFNSEYHNRLYSWMMYGE